LVRVGRLRNGTRNATGVVVLVKIADECAVGNVEGLLLAEPTAELDGGPVELTGECGIINDG
jgi:hypothetical protein